MNKLLIGLLALPWLLCGNVGPAGFHQFKNRIFVETGTFGGDGIIKALEAGFEEVYSLDIDPGLHRAACARFKNDPRIHLFLMDSSYQLSAVLENIYEPVTFWLDAHNGFPDPNAIGVKNTPLLEELDQIKNHPIKTHTIMIDDLHCCNTLLFDFLSLDDIVKKVLEVNPDYNIIFVEGGNDGEYPNNILVALPPSQL